nr:hypothetical protein GCM10020063_000100 [Dactylosporangium thailandense]
MFPAASFTQHSHRLLPGHSVLLYADRLIKRGALDEGIGLLAERITRRPSAHRLGFDAAGDDACALLARRIA